MQVTALHRHPVKSYGREALDSVTLEAGQSMPFDRRWAVAHDAAKTEGGAWAQCVNFSRTAVAPALAAINAQLDEETRQLTLTHPALPELTFDPDAEGEALIEWVRPIVPQNRSLPARVLTLPERGFTDAPYAGVSLCSTTSLDALSANAGQPLSPLRWRGNIWFDGALPWAEMDWVGKDLQLGEAVLRVIEPIERCMATTANPDTGARDVDTLGLLNSHWNHQDFGINAEVITSGRVAVGDTLTVL